MARTPRMFTKRSKVMGLPVGRRRTDWRKVGMTGFGLASSVAGSLGARKVGRGVSTKVSKAVGEPIQKGKQALEKVTSVGDQAGSIGQAMSGAKTPFGKIAAGLKSTGGGGDEEQGGGGGQGRNVTKLRLLISESVDVAVPRKVAYNQWTQMEDLSSILKGVARVSQQDDDVVVWSAKIGPSRRQWRAKITEQTPDERIAWEGSDGVENRGAISFHSLDRNLTRVQVEMEYFPRGPIEKIGNIFLSARRRVRKDLRLFKHYMELANQETGAWRGEISKGEDDEGDEQPRDEQQAGEQDTGGGERDGEHTGSDDGHRQIDLDSEESQNRHETHA